MPKHYSPSLNLPPRTLVSIPEEFRTRTISEGHRSKTITLPPVVRQPLVVNFGMGTDSTAMLVLMVRMYEAGEKDAMPDRIIFADVGSEKCNTYKYIPIMRDYLVSKGFPEPIIVRKGTRPGASKDASLHESCHRLHTMPSLAYGGKSCSLKWKAAEMDYCHDRWDAAQAAWAAGLRVMKLIGYDASPADLRRSTIEGDDQYQFIYPLRDIGLKRDQLIRIIEDEGLPQPGKSACFCCPAMKRQEVIDLAWNDPQQCADALLMEARALLRSAQELNMQRWIEAYLRPKTMASVVKVSKRPGTNEVTVFFNGDISDHRKRITEILHPSITTFKWDGTSNPRTKLTTMGLGRNWSWREHLESVGVLVTLEHLETGAEEWAAYRELRGGLVPTDLEAVEIETCDDTAE